MQELFRITYFSKQELFGEDDNAQIQIASILSSAKKNNPAQEITGALLYSGGFFVQVIEGVKEKVEALYDTILLDPRHSHVTVLSYEACEARLFQDWSMAFAGIDESLKFTLDGLMDSTDEMQLQDAAREFLQTLQDKVFLKHINPETQSLIDTPDQASS